MKSERGTESSVQVRLAEVMALEQDRITMTEENKRREESERCRREREAEATRRRVEASRKRAEETRQRAAEQAQRDADAKRELQRETAFARIRLEAEAREATKRQEMLWQHEVALQRMRTATSDGAGWRNAMLALLVVVIAGVLIHAGMIHPRLVAAAAEVPEREAYAAQAETLAYKNRNAILRERVAQLEAEVAHPESTTLPDVTERRPVHENPARRTAGARVGAGRSGSRPLARPPSTPLDSIDFDSTDPLTGLGPTSLTSSGR